MGSNVHLYPFGFSHRLLVRSILPMNKFSLFHSSFCSFLALKRSCPLKKASRGFGSQPSKGSPDWPLISLHLITFWVGVFYGLVSHIYFVFFPKEVFSFPFFFSLSVFFSFLFFPYSP